MSKYPYGPWTKTQGWVSDTSQYTSVLDNELGFLSSVNRVLPSGNYQVRTGFNSLTDHVTPRSASLYVIQREFVGYTAKMTSANGANWVKTRNPGSWYPTSVDGSWSDSSWVSPGASQQEVRDKAFNKLINKLGPEISGLVTLGELKESAGTVASYTSKIAGRQNKLSQSLTNLLTKRSIKSVGQLAATVADELLEFRFGVQPLISDVANIASYIRDKSINDEFPVRRVSASYRDVANNSSRFARNQTIQLTVRNMGHFAKVAKIGCTLPDTLPDGVSEQLSEIGFSSRQFVPALWELTPYSWLIDYFTNVGDIINLCSLRRGVVKNGWIVEIFNTSRISIAVPGPSPAAGYPKLVASTEGTYKERVFSFNRQPFDVDSYVPTFRVELPNLRRATNVVALAVSRIGKSGRKEHDALSQAYSLQQAMKLNEITQRRMRSSSIVSVDWSP